MNNILRIIRSFWPWRRYAKTPTPRALQVKAHRQWTSYSCTAAVAQMVTHYYGIKLGHRAAIALTRCHPDGASLSTVARALKRAYGLQPRTLQKRAEVRVALDRQQPVISNDALTYEHDHAILVIGATPKGFWIADPAVGEIYWRHQRQFFAAADEFIAIRGRRNRKETS